MTADAKIYIELLSPDPIPAKYLYSSARHAVRFSANDAVFRIETDGKSAKIVKTAEVGYELVLGKTSSLTLKTAGGEFLEPDIRLHYLNFNETENGFLLDISYSVPPHDENTKIYIKCEK